MENSNEFEETPLRRSRRKPKEKNTVQKLDVDITSIKGITVVENTLVRRSGRKPTNKKNDDQNSKTDQAISNLNQDQMLKTSKSVNKKFKVKNEISSPKFEPTSVDISGFGLKDLSPSLPEMAKIKTELVKSFDMQPLIDYNYTIDAQEKISSEKPKVQRNRKRKARDLVEDSVSPEKNEKTASKKKLTSKNISTKVQGEKEPEISFEPIMKEKLLIENNNSAFIGSSTSEKTVLQVLAQHELGAGSESPPKTLIKESCDSSSESDWEEVEERTEVSLDDYNPVIPKDGVEITIDCPELNVRKRKKKQFDHMEYIRLYINRERKDHQLNVHKTHILCLLAHGLFVNNILNLPYLRALALSYLPSDLLAVTAGRKIDKADSGVIRNVVSWFCENFSFENKQLPFIDFQERMPNYFQERKSSSPSEYNLLFVVFARVLGFKSRLCVSLNPVSHKAKNLLKKPCSKEKVERGPKEELKKSIVATKDKKVKSDISLKEKKLQLRRSKKAKSCKLSSGEDEDFVETNSKKIKQVKKMSKNISGKRSNRNVLSSDSEPDTPENQSFEEDKIICWCEVFSKPDKQWISIECTNAIVDKPYDIEKLLPKPVAYILGYDNDCYVKDLTKRYCSEYMTSTLKLRVDSDWWEETLEYFAPPNSKLNKDEEKKLEEILVNKPLPKTVGEFKNHPLYALKRHLLKFEAIYPPDAAPVGFLREEPVYARDNVCKLHSRETWVKEARVVRAGEEPYKIVKARPKWDRIAGVMRTDLPLEVFGFWQTDPYEPPTAEGGKVPRNEYGNVELFKPCMLPHGTVHLQIPCLNRIAKKLGIDCSAAVVGFDGHKGSIHPVFDGFVVCEEFEDTLIAAWEEEQVNAKKREEEKREKRIYGNWKKLIKGLLIRERIKLKYNVK
ncbi:DNA repair protein complementing XP-C cells homolog [Parasteatoda tepidariorum]|uniref:DNA repair protein complementing XP-C cells homolog n=1 Tax=Parasteatoda tepidariorum TaxID=114398 RepID=UPI00077FD2B2|nr:DNA repair protein complementing XP-C cells homolog [Parasteatoda tepidariorum]XP_042904948.1 DNA repair protein complementing XP-C cells homolog [Parasteatoda tepidariorum]